MLRYISIFILFLLIPSLAQAELRGRVTVLDGDTIVLATARGKAKVRLHGIDTPEAAQLCTNSKGRRWACGEWVSGQVRKAFGGRQARCTEIDIDKYGRHVARCTVEGRDMGAAIVRNGWAVAYVKYSSNYVKHEVAAQRENAGLWSGTFQRPSDHREAHRARRASTTAPKQGNCNIKGNISSKGTHIFHVPGQQFYSRTRISAHKGERWFCTAEEARAAGWRASRS